MPFDASRLDNNIYLIQTQSAQATRLKELLLRKAVLLDHVPPAVLPITPQRYAAQVVSGIMRDLNSSDYSFYIQLDVDRPMAFFNDCAAELKE